jgi:hypothetical protein
MRAATAALQFEHPKLSAQQLVHIDGSWAERLDRAIEKSAPARNGGSAKVIEHQPQPSIRRI